MGKCECSLLALVVICALGCSFAASPIFFEDFSSSSWTSNFIKSKDDKYSGELVAEIPKGLQKPALKVTEKARHYGYAANLDKDVDPVEGIVLQYELKLSDGLSCGGAYLKFLNASKEFDASGLVEDTPYVVMFGPDKCGATNKVHLILRHKAPSGKIEEKHLKSPPLVLQDTNTHVYTAILRPDNTYEVLIDGESKKSGSLFEDFEPPFNPPEEIDDPEETKPEDWVDQARIPDPDAVKPEDWDEDAAPQIEDSEAEKPEGWLHDEPAEVNDPEAEKPEDWDEEEDGEWEPPQVPNPKCTEGPGCGEWKRPLIPNPAYKGKWSAPLIDNPAYKGVWKPAKIANPDYFLDEEPLKNIGKVGGVAIEIWTMDNNYFFDNILIDNDSKVAEEIRESHWKPKKPLEDAVAPKDPETVESGGRVAGLIRKVFELPGLSILESPLEPLLDYIDENESAAYLVAGAILAIPLFLLLSIIPRGKASKNVKATVEEIKKADKPTPDDKPSTKTAALVAEEDDEDDGKKSVRRRRQA